MLKRYGFLIGELVRRDFKGSYAGSLLGFLWSFVNPLWQLILFTFVFSTVLKISPVGERTNSFAIFLFAGLLPWMAIQEGVSRATTAITDNAQIVKKLSFPTEILVLVVVLSALLHEAIAAVVFFVVIAFVGGIHWAGLPLLLVILPIQFALTFGLGLALAPLHVIFRDTAQFLGLFFQGWFYLTPIVYPLGMIPAKYRFWLDLNPLTALVGLYRRALLGSPTHVSFGFLVALAVVSLVLLGIGLVIFRHMRSTLADEI